MRNKHWLMPSDRLFHLKGVERFFLCILRAGFETIQQRIFYPII